MFTLTPDRPHANPQLTRGAQRERLEVRLLAPVWDLPLLVFLGVKVGRDVYRFLCSGFR
jgi:hypothetical protein